MNTDTQNLQNKFDELPKEIKEAITSVDFAEKLQSIGRKNGLMIDQLDPLLEEVGLIMLGETETKDFGRKISSRLGMPSDKTDSLVRNVDQEIFQPIRASLITLYPSKPTAAQNILPPPAKPSTFTRQSALGGSGEQPAKPSSDYDMSRAAILSAIENPEVSEAKTEIVFRHGVEATDPHKYLLSKEEIIKKISDGKTDEKTDKKKSLAEEAYDVAKTKTRTMAPPEMPIENPPLADKKESIPAALPAYPTAPPPMPAKIPLSPNQKLSSVVQVPRTNITVEKIPEPSKAATDTTLKKTLDPYREPV